jgi:hypothetical protein
MTHAIGTVFIEAILVPLLRELGLPETFPLSKLSHACRHRFSMRPRACNATQCHTRHSLCWLGAAYSLTRESYLNIKCRQGRPRRGTGNLPDLSQELLIEERVA